MGFGDYPKYYDPAKHGNFNPAIYYGPKDTPFGELKLCDIGNWIRRREKTPSSIAGLFSRAFWRWQMKYIQPRRTGIAPLAQATIGLMAFFYVLNYKRKKVETHYKYH